MGLGVQPELLSVITYFAKPRTEYLWLRTIWFKNILNFIILSNSSYKLLISSSFLLIVVTPRFRPLPRTAWPQSWLANHSQFFAPRLESRSSLQRSGFQLTVLILPSCLLVEALTWLYPHW